MDRRLLRHKAIRRAVTEYDPDIVEAEGPVTPEEREWVSKVVDLVAWRNTILPYGGFEGFDRFAIEALWHVSVKGPDTTTSTVADAMDTNTSSISAPMKGLVAAGYVDKRDDPEDRRFKLLTVTEDGLAFIERHLSWSHERLLAAGFIDEGDGSLPSRRNRRKLEEVSESRSAATD